MRQRWPGTLPRAPEVPQDIQTMNKRADIVNPTDTLSWHVTYLYMTVTRKKVL